MELVIGKRITDGKLIAGFLPPAAVQETVKFTRYERIPLNSSAFGIEVYKETCAYLGSIDTADLLGGAADYFKETS